MGSDAARELVVRRDEIGEAQVRPADVAGQPGGVILAIERFALTANNVTYAVMGDALQYWRFFPTVGPELGIVPAWGAATVVASDHVEVAVGERWYGFVPMATHLVVQPGQVGEGSVVDASPHRAGLADVYQRYLRLEADPLHDPATLDLELLYRPLFTTAFLPPRSWPARRTRRMRWSSSPRRHRRPRWHSPTCCAIVT